MYSSAIVHTSMMFVLTTVVGFSSASPYRVYLPAYCTLEYSPGLIIKPKKTNYTIGDTIELSCKDGYILNDKMPRQSTCHVEYPFTGSNILPGYGAFIPGGMFHMVCLEIPICKQLRVGAQKTGDNRNISTSCEKGYELVEYNSSTCKMRMQDHDQSKNTGRNQHQACRKIRKCELPLQIGVSILNTKPIKPFYEPGENISIACDDDYELTVDPIGTCQYDGFFSFINKTNDKYFVHFSHVCSKKARCKHRHVYELSESPLKDVYESGEEISITCREKYELIGHNTFVCGYQGGSDTSLYIKRLYGLGQFPIEIYSACRRKPVCYKPKLPGLALTPDQWTYEIGEEVTLSCVGSYDAATELTSSVCRRTGDHKAEFEDTFGSSPCNFTHRCRPPAPQPGLIIHPMKNEYDMFERIRIRCKRGFRLVADSVDFSCIYSITQYNPRYIPRAPPVIYGDYFDSVKSTTFHPDIPMRACRKIQSEERAENKIK